MRERGNILYLGMATEIFELTSHVSPG